MTVQRQALRPSREHPADGPRPVGRHAHPRPRQHSGEHSRTWASARTTTCGSRQIIKRPNGIFLVTGPTGSGKTTTLYAALNELNRPDRKIITAEDPVEYYLPGHQPGRGEAQDRAGLRPHHPRHAAASPEHHPGRRNPRQGDGRDRRPGLSDGTLGFQYTTHERCAQRYYTPGATSACRRSSSHRSRDRHHGPAPGPRDLPEVQGAVHAAAGRTARRPASRRSSWPRPTSCSGRGCNHCHQTGYRGRLGIFEMMRMNSAIREMTFNREPDPGRSAARPALPGMRTLLEDGVDKALKGMTTLDEVLSTCHAEVLDHAAMSMSRIGCVDCDARSRTRARMISYRRS